MSEEPKDEKKVSEGVGEDLYSKWQDTIGPLSGADFVTELTSAIGYGSLEDFFDDNPGAVTAIEQFVVKYLDRLPDWQEKMRMEVPEE